MNWQVIYHHTLEELGPFQSIINWSEKHKTEHNSIELIQYKDGDFYIAVTGLEVEKWAELHHPEFPEMTPTSPDVFMTRELEAALEFVHEIKEGVK